MATMTSGTLSYAMDETVTEMAFSGFMNNPLFMPSLFTIRPSSGPRETPASMGELEVFDVKTEGSAATEASLNQEFTKTFTHKAYAKLLRLTRELQDDDKWGVVADMGSQLGEAASETIEEQVGNMFNNLENTTYFTTEGGLSLANTAHLNAAAANSQSNNASLSLDYAGLKSTRTAMRRWKGYKATTFKNVIGDELLLGPDLEEDAWQLVNSVQRPGNANNDGNMFNGRYTVYVFHRITSTTAWTMMASKERKRFLRFYDRVPLEIMADDSFEQQTRKIGGYMRFSMGTTDWKWLYHQSP